MARKPADIVPLMVRLRESLRARLERAAERNQRSMNLEIAARLEQSFTRDEMRAGDEERKKAMDMLNRSNHQLMMEIRNSWAARAAQLGTMHRQLLKVISTSSDSATAQAALGAIAELDRMEEEDRIAEAKRAAEPDLWDAPFEGVGESDESSKEG